LQKLSGLIFFGPPCIKTTCAIITDDFCDEQTITGFCITKWY